MVIVNRGLAAVSFLLVGFMTLLLESSTQDMEELTDADDDNPRERELLRFLVDLPGPLEPHDLMSLSATGLRHLLRADAVVIAGLNGDKFAQPRWTDPSRTDLAAIGTPASWAVDPPTVTAAPVIGIRSDLGLMHVAHWQAETSVDLILVTSRPSRRRSVHLLSDAMIVLVPLRECALALQRARNGTAHDARLDDDGRADRLAPGDNTVSSNSVDSSSDKDTTTGPDDPPATSPIRKTP